MERMRQGLELAQRGAVTPSEDGEDLSAAAAVTTSTRLTRTCSPAPARTTRSTCRPASICWPEVHLGALGLAAPVPEPSAAAATTAEEVIKTAAVPSTADWPISEAPASLNIKLKVGNMEVMYTMRDVDDPEAARRATMSLPWLQEILHGCEADLAAREQEAERRRQQAEEERQAQARSLDEQIAAAVAAAMKAQTSRNNGQNPQQRTAAAPPQPPDADGLASAHDHEPSWCPKHQVTMRWHDGNARGPGWFSHQLADGSYCKGK